MTKRAFEKIEAGLKDALAHMEDEITLPERGFCTLGVPKMKAQFKKQGSRTPLVEGKISVGYLNFGTPAVELTIYPQPMDDGKVRRHSLVIPIDQLPELIEQINRAKDMKL